MASIKSKQYSYTTKDDHESKKLKGVKKNVLKRDIKFNDYKDCVFEESTKNIIQKGIKA